MRTQLARNARANELGHLYAELAGDPAFAADARKYDNIYTRDWTWSVLFGVATSAVKRHLFELEAIAPDLLDLHAYWKEVAPESRAALKAAVLLLSKIPGMLAATFLAFEREADRIELQEGLASESEDEDMEDNDENHWVEWGTDDDDEAKVPAAPAAQPEAPAATIEDGDESEDDDDIILVSDTAAPVAATELALVPAEPTEPAELALVPADPAEAESESLGGTPAALLVSTRKIQNVLSFANSLALECASPCPQTAKLSECMGLLSGNGTDAERALAFTNALCSGSAGVLAAVQAALAHSPAALLKELHVDIRNSHLHAAECLASEDPEGFTADQKLEFEKSVLSKLVTELNCIQLELDICTRTNTATPHPALRTRLDDLSMRRKSMVYGLSVVTDNIARLSAPLPPLTVAAALALLALSPSAIRSDAPEATHAVEAAHRTALLSCHPNTARLANVDEDTTAICVAKCVSIGAAKDVLFDHIEQLEAALKALREAELKLAEAVDAADLEAGLKRKHPLDSEPQEPQDDCFGDGAEPPRDENASDEEAEPRRKAARL